MTSVAILPKSGPMGERSYDAVAGERRSEGRTVGEALDALTAQLPEEEAGTLIVVQHGRPDAFFTESQQRRLGQLMQNWRSARESGNALPADEQSELEALVEGEVTASAKRAAALAGALGG